MDGYRWTTRVGLGGLGSLAPLAAVVAVTRIFDLVVAGVQPEARALTAMMTAAFTVGAVVPAHLGDGFDGDLVASSSVGRSESESAPTLSTSVSEVETHADNWTDGGSGHHCDAYGRHCLQRPTTGCTARDCHRHRSSGAQPHQAVN